MVTYYDDRSVRITSVAVTVDGDAYPLTEITEVWHHRGSRSWRVLAGRGALGAAMIGPVVAAVAGIALAVWLDGSATLTVAIIGVSILTGLAAGPLADQLFEHFDRSYARGSRPREVWIRWRGHPVRLLRTPDALRFGQIYRALQRALEAEMKGRAPY
ncbi:hypothetical protein Vqi01_44600 [Micromonospora qiuiae]|uniref:Uncharacterized protein n=1 Tax=Micromonospora qiuiae TaxID=502268 RepID=A0ABQ4JFX9_9ACTN|nr:DUF6232 family protein [Micromonospora qiuiae]GIJ29298.1 hypothetical protein Vqi01_44600 [Micromonospora qiuiae]